MAVLKIKVASIIVRMTALDNVTAVCGKAGIFHPDNPLSFYSDTSDFSPLNEENPYIEPLQQLADAVDGNHKRLYLLDAPALEGVNYTEDEIDAYISTISEKFGGLQADRSDAQQRIEDYSREISQISHFTGMALDLDSIRECSYIKVRFGFIPKESFEKLKHYDQNPYIIFFPCSSDDEHYWGIYFSPVDQVSEVDRIFSSLYFQRVRLAELKDTPEQAVADLRSAREVQLERIQRIDSQLSSLWEQEKDHCLKLYSWLREHSVYFGIRHFAARYNDNFILTGWIPAEDEALFRAELDKIPSVELYFEDASEELAHSPPVKLKNHKPFKPFEFFVDMYGLPKYDEVDPTTFVAITYFLLFGIMFADVGQGICVSIVGWLMWKFKKMKLGQALIPCGISSAVFGVVFGSVFGYEHVLDPFYQSVFGLKSKPIEIMEPDATVGIIIAAVCIGIFLVLTAILINIVCSLKQKHYQRALFGPNGIAGFVFYGGLVLGFGGQMVLGWPILSLPYILLVIVLPLIIILFQEVLGGLAEHRPDWKPDSWGGYIAENFFELFEVLLAYASNTISFLRVGAFVLVHAGMMTMVFTLADMSGGIAYILIVIIGNIIVMGMEGLLVGIQVMRLEFYEMFSRFFEGGGRPFKPVVVRGEF